MIRRLGVLVLLFTTMCGVGLAQGVALDARLLRGHRF